MPSDAKRLEFNWNFCSEEFTEYCGDIYQDFFKVELIVDGVAQPLFSRRIDHLCDSVSKSSLGFDQSGPSCEPNSDPNGVPNDCLVWTTNWQFQSIDISAIAKANAGKNIKLRFSAGDIGDSIFDSAILLDEIKIITPPK